MTLPSWQDLGAGRHWHFFFAWLLLFNWLNSRKTDAAPAKPAEGHAHV